MDFKRGTLKSFNASTYLATVLIEGGLSVYLANIPTSRNIASAEMTAGRKIAVLFFDEANPDDAVITAVWT